MLARKGFLMALGASAIVPALPASLEAKTTAPKLADLNEPHIYALTVAVGGLLPCQDPLCEELEYRERILRDTRIVVPRRGSLPRADVLQESLARTNSLRGMRIAPWVPNGYDRFIVSDEFGPVFQAPIMLGLTPQGWSKGQAREGWGWIRRPGVRQPCAFLDGFTGSVISMPERGRCRNIVPDSDMVNVHARVTLDSREIYHTVAPFRPGSGT
jgi:hypothetical protein